MELDFTDVAFDTKLTKPHEIEEVFEDPFALRLIPENDREDGETRYYLLGKTVSNRGLFLSFWTNGKKARVIAARELTENESSFYDRVTAEIK